MYLESKHELIRVYMCVEKSFNSQKLSENHKSLTYSNPYAMLDRRFIFWIWMDHYWWCSYYQ